MKKIILDIDKTICFTKSGDYECSTPNLDLIKKIQDYKKNGFEIILYTSRNMRTYDGNVGKINKVTLPVLIAWLEKHGVIYDEIYVGKPWCGFEGFYVDDRAIRPSEFVDYDYEEILKIIK